jgi:hypothetical protein
MSRISLTVAEAYGARARDFFGPQLVKKMDRLEMIVGTLRTGSNPPNLARVIKKSFKLFAVTR